MSPEARLALLLLEELELRGGRARLRYLKVYRMMNYWLGPEAARRVMERLSSTGYLRISGDTVELIRRFKVDKSLRAVYREARDVVVRAYLGSH